MTKHTDTSRSGDLLQKAYAMLARWHCELRHTARHVTYKEVGDLLDRIKGLNQ